MIIVEIAKNLVTSYSVCLYGKTLDACEVDSNDIPMGSFTCQMMDSVLNNSGTASQPTEATNACMKRVVEHSAKITESITNVVYTYADGRSITSPRLRATRFGKAHVAQLNCCKATGVIMSLIDLHQEAQWWTCGSRTLFQIGRGLMAKVGIHERKFL